MLGVLGLATHFPRLLLSSDRSMTTGIAAGIEMRLFPSYLMPCFTRGRFITKSALAPVELLQESPTDMCYGAEKMLCTNLGEQSVPSPRALDYSRWAHLHRYICCFRWVR